jgi:hypothetical protein
MTGYCLFVFLRALLETSVPLPKTCGSASKRQITTSLADQYLEQGYVFLKTEDGTKVRFPPLTPGEIEIEKALEVKRDSEYVNLDKFFPPLKIHNHFTTTSAAMEFMPLPEIKNLSADQIDEWQRTGAVNNDDQMITSGQVKRILEIERKISKMERRNFGT